MGVKLLERFESWLRPDKNGLYCVPGGFYIDPQVAVDKAIITHGHSDHARSGHQHVLATAPTLDIMKLRLGTGSGLHKQIAEYNERLNVNDVAVTLHPAGHILGSAQVEIEYRGRRAVVSGDYKRRSDPTCAQFEVVKCDLFITEATFGLPVFRHEPDQHEIDKLLVSLSTFPDRTHQIGVYGLGKCQRLIKLLRLSGYDKPIWLHGAMTRLCEFYNQMGIELGDLRAVQEATDKLPGAIVLCPPSALGDRWSSRFSDPLISFASGWMRIRARAKQRGVELPLVISDHADWPELVQTIKDVGADEIWITHGREDALSLQCEAMGLRARALALIGFDEEGD